ncbi:MAG: cyd operon YbgE family protein [Methylorubrum rhodinum]|uniref:cyd operon YbgE family protein n=1 Tax=Methylorubrum rhodinum TaxID=29428 RepID=UPI003BB0010E
MSITTSSRAASLATALVLSAALLLYPRILGARLGPVEHAVLPLLLLGVSGAFVSGLGYRPDNRVARAVLSPAAAWSLMTVGVALLALRRLAI